MSVRLLTVFGLFVALGGCGRSSVVTTPPIHKETNGSVQSKARAPASAGTSHALPEARGSTQSAAPAAVRGDVGSFTAELPAGWPYRATSVTGQMGMVVTDDAAATEIGRDVLASGGNAVDAAVAVAFALAVTYPTAGNLGGGGFAVTLTNGEARALDFREVAPAAAHRDMYVGSDGKPRADAREGILSVGVPGSVAGLWELHRTLGSKRRTWAELLAPSIALADGGFVVDAEFANGLTHVADRMRTSPASKKLFFPGGKPLVEGSKWRNPDLARVLKRIAEQGAAGFYRGPTARAIVEQMRRSHGLIVQADLDHYVPKWRQPLRFDYRGAKLTTMPPPSSGGVTLAMICHVVEAYDLRALGFQSPEALQVVFEAMRRSFAARNAKLGDPDFAAMPLDELLSARWAEEQRATITPNHATPSTEIVSTGAGSNAGPHTTHFSVVDRDGNAVALTTTLNYWYGSGITVQGAGFVLNNEMDDFAAVPGTPNGYGLVQGEANAVAPGKRMLSSMSPTIVTGADGKVLLVAGAAGGPTIITAVFQEISNALDFDADFASAVAAPRFHMQHLPDAVVFEKHGLPDDKRTRLERMGYQFTEKGHIADAPLIGRKGAEWVGVAEPRRRGALAAAP